MPSRDAQSGRSAWELDPLKDAGKRGPDPVTISEKSAQEWAREGTEFEMAKPKRPKMPVDPSMGAHNTEGKYLGRIGNGKI